MKIDNIVSQNLDEKSARPALFVLGMHRSGTSAITGALRHSGVWVGEETELTDANVENPLGFWERRDIRDLCDQMLHSAGADWWKVASFEPKAIPRTALAEQRRKFEKIVSELDKYQAWVIKEPRLCLLLPILRHYVKNLVCIHIHRNPLEVARSLQTRNGFSIFRWARPLGSIQSPCLEGIRGSATHFSYIRINHAASGRNTECACQGA